VWWGKPLIVLLDEGTPILSATPFLDRGHQVIYHDDVLSGGASDEVVVATAILNKAALIAVDVDFKRIVKRFGPPNSSEKYSKFDLIFIGCDPVMASKRIEHAMSFIENEWAVSREKASRRLWLDISNHRLTTHR